MRIQFTDDFDPRLIAESGQCFRWYALDGKSWRVLHGAHCLILTEAGPQTYDLDCTEAEYDVLWRPYLDMDESYAAIRGRIDPAEDPFLFAAAQNQRGLRILRQDPWETLASFIVSQNRNIPIIRRSIELLCQGAGAPCRDSRGEPYFAFPTPEAVATMSDAALASCKLGYRDGYLRAAAVAVAAGRVDLAALCQAEPEESLAALLALRGVGVKVAACVQLFGLHQLDAFPVDVWIRRVLDAEYPGGYPRERYSPYNGVCQQYMFAYYRGKSF